jgi:hypothetical protein
MLKPTIMTTKKICTNTIPLRKERKFRLRNALTSLPSADKFYSNQLQIEQKSGTRREHSLTSIPPAKKSYALSIANNNPE